MRLAVRMLALGHAAGRGEDSDRRNAELICLTDQRGANDLAQRVLRQAAQACDLPGVAEGHFTLGLLAATRGDWSTAHLHGRLAVELEAGRLAEAYLLLGMGALRSDAGATLADRYLGDAARAARETCDSSTERLACLEMATAALLRGDPAGARPCLRRAVVLQPDTDPSTQLQTLCLEAWAARLEGDREAFLPLVRLATDLIDRTQDHAALILGLSVVGEHLAGEGQAGGAAAVLQRCRWNFAQWVSGTPRQEPAAASVMSTLVLQQQVLMAHSRLTSTVTSVLPDAAAGSGG